MEDGGKGSPSGISTATGTTKGRGRSEATRGRNATCKREKAEDADTAAATPAKRRGANNQKKKQQQQQQPAPPLPTIAQAASFEAAADAPPVPPCASPPAHWRCPTCTYINRWPVEECEMCIGDRPTEAAAVAAAAAGAHELAMSDSDELDAQDFDEPDGNALHEALVEYEDEVAALSLIEEGCDVNAPQGCKTPLMMAAEVGMVRVMEALVNKRADMEARGEMGGRALHVALDHGQEAAARCLIEQGCNVNASNSEGTTPLMLAAARGMVRMMKMLVASGGWVGLDRADKQGRRAVHAALINKQESAALFLIRQGCNTEAPDCHGRTPLYLATQAGFEEATDLITAKNAIFRDIKQGDLEEVKRRVLEDAAVLEFREHELKRTPLMWAIFHEKPAIAEWIIDNRGQHNLSTRCGNDDAALHIACSTGLLSVVKLLVAGGVDPTLYGDETYTPLMTACRMGHADIVEYLVSLPTVRDADAIDATSLHEMTALCWAVDKGHESIVQLLLDAGADPTIPNNSVLPFAVRKGYKTIASMLRRASRRKSH